MKKKLKRTLTRVLFSKGHSYGMNIVQQGLSWEFETAGARLYCPKICGCQAPLAPVLTQALYSINHQVRHI